MTDTQQTVRKIRFAHTSRGGEVFSDLLPTPHSINREWVWGSATGSGIRVCILDSGVDVTHPLVGGAVDQYAVSDDDRFRIVRDDAGDVAGHGTACAGIIRALAPDCALTSVRVLTKNLRGTGEALLAALQWAVSERFDLINLSLSTRKETLKARLHDIADEAYFNHVTLVSAAHNGPVDSYPWRFPSVISVGSHSNPDPEYLECNPEPPVEFFATGVDVPAAWPGGGIRSLSGNSFATPHVVGLCARILERHPGFGAAQLKQLLAAISNNVRTRE